MSKLNDIITDELNFENKVYLANTHFFKLPVCYSILNSYLKTEANEGIFKLCMEKENFIYIYIYIYMYTHTHTHTHTHVETRDMQKRTETFLYK